MQKYKIIPLDEFPNMYGAYDSGIIQNVKTNKILKQHLKNGYMTVHFYNYKTKMQKTVSVSRMIALTFIGTANDIKMVVNHKDGNKLNNNVYNLEWITQKDNVVHAFNNGLTKTHASKISKFDINGNLIENYESIEDASYKHNVTRHAIIRALKGKSKTSGGFVWKYTSDTLHNQKCDLELMRNIPDCPYKISENGSIYSIRSNKILKPMKNANDICM